MAGILDPVNELAGSPHRDRELFCDVVHPAYTVLVDDLHWFEPGQREIVAGPESPINRVPQLGLKANHLAKQVRVINHTRQHSMEVYSME